MNYYDLLLAKSLGGSGGGGGGKWADDDIAKRNYTGAIDITVDGGLANYAFNGCANITSVNAPNITTIGNYAFSNCTSLTSVDMPNAVSMGAEDFIGCTSLVSVSLPLLRKVDLQNAFKNCTSLESIALPNAGLVYKYVKSGFGASFFEGCTSLKTVDGGFVASVGANCFKGCVLLDVIVLRKTDSITTLQNINAFANMNGKAVTIYVPSSLKSNYESGTNWVNVTGATLTFANLEGSIYE